MSSVLKIKKEYLIDEDSSKALYSFIQSTLDDYPALQLSRMQAKDLLEGIIKYYQFHIENFRPLKSKPVLETIFSNL